MKKYEAYKDSEVEWVGLIPISWGNSKIKYLANSQGTLFIDGDWIESNVITEDGIRYITTGNVGEGFYKEQGSGYISEKTFSELNCTEVFEGDLLMSRLNNPIGRSCIVPKLNKRIVTSVDNVILRPNENIDKKYLLYLFSSKEYFEHTSLIARGATMQRISRGLLGNVKIPLPSKSEQTAIANYLDHKTSKLDTLITKKEKLTELLQEERSAIINHAVTQGLDPNVPMRDSGIEWLGEIPKHWGVKKLKYLLKHIKGGGTPSTDNPAYWNGGIPWVSPKDMKVPFIESTEDYVTEIAISESSTMLIEEGHVLLVVRSGILKHTLPLAINNVKVTLNQDMKALLGNEMINTLYLYSMLSGFSENILTFCKKIGATVDSLDMEVFLNFNFPVPPLDEQSSIIEFINSTKNEIDLIISKTTQEIELFREYKTALIFEVVTGKLDVRNEILN